MSASSSFRNPVRPMTGYQSLELLGSKRIPQCLADLLVPVLQTLPQYWTAPMGDHVALLLH